MLSLNLKELNIHTDFNDRMQNGLNQLQAQIVHCTRPFLHRSMPFCSRCKAPWTNFKAFLYTCKTVMQAFKPLLHTAQNRPANVQGPIVPCVKPPCKCSEPHCSWYKTVLSEWDSIINSPRKSADPKIRWPEIRGRIKKESLIKLICDSLNF